MPAPMSTSFHGRTRAEAVADFHFQRYHVGRHVANLQVTNTYEGTHVRILCHEILLRRLALTSRTASGHTCAYPWQGNDWSSGLRELN